MQRKIASSVVALWLAWAIPGVADTVTVSDPSTAGSLPSSALDLTSHPFLTEITGNLDFTNPDFAALFEIDIVNPQFFSAYTVFTGVSASGTSGIPNPELFLFDQNGNAVEMNDDISTTPVNTQSCLPSANSIGNPCPAARPTGIGPLTSGLYFLGITPSANTPLDASLNPLFLFTGDTSAVLGPNPGAGPLASWDQGFSNSDFDQANYDIYISDTPEPLAWPVTAVLGLGMMVFRRRLMAR